MRAHRNPTWMRAIERAALDLVRRFRSLSPACVQLGSDVIERIAGLPCEWCGEPTHVVRPEVSTCQGGNYRLESRATSATTADSGLCESRDH